MKIYCVRQDLELEVWVDDEWESRFSVRKTIDFSDPQSAMRDVESLLADLSYEYFDGVGSVAQREQRVEDMLDLSTEAIEESISELEHLLSRLKELVSHDADRQTNRKFGTVHPVTGSRPGGGSVGS